jgi:hypothetical protein
MRLMLREGPDRSSRALNVRHAEQACTAVVAAGIGGLLAAAIWRTWWPLGFTAAAILVVLAVNVGFYRYLLRHRSVKFTVGVMPFHLLYYVGNVVAVFAGWLVHVLFGAPIPPPSADALARSGISTWPPPIRKSPESVWRARPSRPVLRPEKETVSP